jgi:hypothetical protein
MGDAASLRPPCWPSRSGWRVKFDATGLIRLAGGRFYQAWLRKSRRRARADRDV